MKKQFIFRLCIFVILISFLTACGKSDENAIQEESTTNSTVNNSDKSTEEKENLQATEKESKEKYRCVEEDVKTLYESLEKYVEDRIFDEFNIASKSPDQSSLAVIKLQEIDEIMSLDVFNYYSFKKGDDPSELMVFVPFIDGNTLKAYSLSFDEESKEHRKDKLLLETKISRYESTLIETPIRDSRPDLLIEISNEEDTICWYNVFDGIPVYNMAYYVNDTYLGANWKPGGNNLSGIVMAYDGLMDFWQVKQRIADGMTLTCTYTVEEIDGAKCIVFAAYNNFPGSNAIEVYYAYDIENHIGYRKYPNTLGWFDMNILDGF
ncbi:MAG: hypothetical protein Q4D95_01215 [Peptoniphilus sp.]|nr:hypothetical protein [Peptoniphilus sp.]